MSSPDPEAPSDAPQADDPSPGTPVASIRTALTAYRVLAWTTGIWLIALCYEVVLKYIVKVEDPPSWIGVVHGWVYFVYLLSAANLATKVRWPIGKTIGVLLAGTIPLLGVIVEHFQTKQVKAAFNL
jgi:integral membrane protein